MTRRAVCRKLKLAGSLLAFTVSVSGILPELQGEDKPAREPRLLSVFPCVGSRGARVRVNFRGSDLDGAFTLFSDDKGLSATVRGIELLPEPAPAPPKPESKTARVQLALLDVDISSIARPGVHWLRIVSPGGVTNAVTFRVTEGPVVQEQSGPHASGADAQDLRLPALITGRLSEPGEVDVYAFHAEEGQEFRFRVAMAENFEPRLALFRDQPSWFGSGRNPRVLFQEEQSSDLMTLDAHGTFRAVRSGRYFLEVSSLFGKGSADCTYELEAVSGEDAGASDKSDREQPPWRERSFTRPLSAAWIDAIAERSLDNGGARASQPVSRANDREPNDNAAQAQLLTLPALIEGKIERPGDVDTFRFRVEAGQKLSFEIETPQTPPPHFNPRLSVLDDRGHQMFANLQRRISLFNNNAETEVYLKAIEPKAIYTFPSAGDYMLQLRDITARYGGDTYVYRVLIRLQAPHVGEVSSPDLDHVNLARNTARKIAIAASLEEGFRGEVVFWMSGLPAGVTAYPAGRIEEERAPLDLPQNAETVLPVSYTSTLILSAAVGAEVSQTPARVSLHCRPVVNGVPGPDLLVRDFPLMVIQSREPKEKQP